MINPERAVEWYKNKYGDTSYSDYDIYEYLQRKFPENEYPDNPFFVKKEEKTPEYEEQDPSAWERILTSGLADNYAEDSDWWADAYNKSTAGTVYEIMHGKPKWEDVDPPEGWWNEVGQFFVGLASPIDVVTFFGSGGIGSVAAMGIAGKTIRKWALSGSKELLKKKGAARGISSKFLNKLSTEAGLESGLSLGMLGATHGALSETAKQSREIKEGTRDKFDPWNITWAATKHGASNVAIGAVAGYTTKGKMAPKFAQASMSKNPSFNNTLTKLTMNPLGQVAAEASVFTTGQMIEKFAMGEPVSPDDFLSGFFMNTGIVGGMRGTTKILRIGQNDVSRFTKAKKSFYKDVLNNKKTEYKSTIDALETIKESYEKEGKIAPKEIVEKLAEVTTEKEVTELALNEYSLSLKDYNKKLKDIESKSPKDLSPSEQAFLLKDSKTHINVLHEFYKEMSVNKDLAYEAYKDFYGGKELTESQKILVDGIIKNKLSSLEKADRVLNGIATGDEVSIKEMKELYAEGFEYKINEQNGKFNLSVENPNGKQVILKTYESRDAANKVGEVIKNEIKSTIEGKVPYSGKPIQYVDATNGKPVVKKGLEYMLDDFKGKTTKEQKKVVESLIKMKAVEVKTGAESDVITLQKQGKAKPLKELYEIEPQRDVVGISDVNNSNQLIDGKIIKAIKGVIKPLEEQIETITPATERMPMSKPVFSKKSVFTENLLNDITPTKDLNTNQQTFRFWSKQKGPNIIRDSLPKMNSVDKVAFVDFAIDYISRKKTDTRNIINDVARFLDDINKQNKDVSQLRIQDYAEFFDKYRTAAPSTGRANAMNQFAEFLTRYKYIDSAEGLNLRDYAKTKFTEFNEYTMKGKNLAKEGVRRFVIEEAIKTKDEGIEIAAKFGARYYIRNLEINKLAEKAKDVSGLEKYLKFDEKTQEYYLDMPMKELAKNDTFDRYVWVDKELATQLTRYIAQDGSLSGKMTKVGQIIKSKGMTNNPNNPFYDLRRRGKSVGKLDYEDVSTMDYMFGHNRNRIDAIYKTLSVSEHIELQKELHKKLNSPIPKETKKEFYRTTIEGDTSKEVQQSRWNALKKYYPEVVTELVKEFKDKSIPEDAVGYLEKLENWTIRVKYGKAPTDVIPHEISHYVFKLMNALEKAYKGERIPDKQGQYTLNLIKEAKKIFVNEEGKFVEEDAVKMIGKAIDGKLEKPIMSKVKGFFKRLNVLFKRLFNRKLSKDDIAYMLGTRIMTRKGVPIMDIGGKREYLKAMDLSPKKFATVIKREIRLASDKFGLSGGDLIKFVAEESGIKSPSKFKISLPRDEMSSKYTDKIEDLNNFYTTLKSFNLDKYVSKKNTLEKLKIIRRIETTNTLERDSRISRGITINQQKQILKAYGVENGDIFKASLNQLKDYSNYIYQQKAVERSNIDWITKSEINNFVDSDIASGLQKAYQEGMFLLGEVGDAIKHAGFKTLGKKLNKHYSIEQGNQSPLLFYEKNSKNILGGISRQSKLDKINKSIWTLDNRGEMLLAHIKWSDKDISFSDKKRIKSGEQFFKKAIKKEWWDSVDKENKRGGDLKKYINLDTKEGLIAQEYFKMTDAFGKNKLNEALITRTQSKAEYEALVENADIDFHSTFVARMITPHGRNRLRLDGKVQRRAIQSMANEIALEEAYRRFGKDTVDKNPKLVKEGKEGETPWDYGLGVAAVKFHDLINFNPGKISIKHLKKRHSLQDLYIPDEKGKLKRTYEWDYDKTVKPYIWGMSKFYATLEMFPEMVKFEGFQVPGIKDQLALLSQGDRIAGRWIEDAVMKQLGFDVSAQPYNITFGAMGTTARWVSKVGLSFPTAGIKNILTGQTQTLYAFKMTDWARGMLDVFTSDSKQYNKAVGTNALGVGNKIYEGGRADRILDKVSFKWSFMKPTEAFNRLSTVFASKYDIRRQIGRLQKYEPGNRHYEKAVSRLKEFYEISDKDIGLLRKFRDSDGVIGRLDGYERFKAQRKLDNIHQNLNTIAHVKTQGSSADLFMPKFAGAKWVKPLTLYKRMAYAATSNTIKNSKMALKNGNIIRPLIGLTATYASGKTMIAVYSNILGTTVPKENSDWWTRFITTMWKGEFVGLLSEGFSPFSDMSQSIHPAIYNTLGSLWQSVGQLIGGQATLSQASEDFFRKNWSLYNNSKKVIQRRNNPFNRDRIRFAKLWNDFEEEVFKKGDMEFEKTTRTPYYRDLRDNFYLGTKEEYSKALASTYISIAHDFYRDHKANTIAEAFKMANTEVGRKFKAFNPNKASFRKENKVKSAKFFKWLQKHPEYKQLSKRLLEIEDEYDDKLKSYNAFALKNWKTMNLNDLIKSFDWKQAKL